ncbi:MAG TPA: GNAT family N-acetyltransferase [Dehalococcoidia bacterium]|nr:GNAT family N-acetyltransferase [Dehalococcoidia bacterium]
MTNPAFGLDFDALLARIEAYYDAVPRSAALVESVGPFTLFYNPGPGWSYYARPSLGSTRFSLVDLQAVRERQRALQVLEALEWVAETSPELGAIAEAAGLDVVAHPLLVLVLSERKRPSIPAGFRLRIAGPDDEGLALLAAVASVGFSSPGTAIGDEGLDELASTAARLPSHGIEFERERLRRGLTVRAGAYLDDRPVAVGSHQPVAGVTEIVGVATLPAYRRRGLATAVVDLLIEDALQRGVETIFLSADDDDVARVYERLGFRRVATACVAEATES